MRENLERIAIIGATGAIGTALLNICIQNHTEAYVLIRSDSMRRKHIPINPLIHCIDCSMEEMKNLNVEQLPEIDVFYYFAWAGTHGTNARNEVYTQIENVKYAIDAVHLAYRWGAKTFVGAGTQAEYGRVNGILHPDTPCNPENGYGIAKLCAGQMSRIECKKLGLCHVWGRAISIYGPCDNDNTMVSCAIRSCLKNEIPEFTKGEQLWDYLYSSDAGNAFYLMGKAGKDEAVYVLGSGHIRPLREYIEIICHTANDKIIPVFGKIPYMDKQVMHLEADISDLTADTGFLPQISFETGIKMTVDWFRNNF